MSNRMWCVMGSGGVSYLIEVFNRIAVQRSNFSPRASYLVQSHVNKKNDGRSVLVHGSEDIRCDNHHSYYPL